MNFEELLEKVQAKPWTHADGWRVVYIWTDEKEGYTIDEEYSTTSEEYEAFKKEYFEYCTEKVLHWHYTTEEGRSILNILLLREKIT